MKTIFILSFIVGMALSLSAPTAQAQTPAPCAYADLHLKVTAYYKQGAILYLGGGGNYQIVKYGVRVAGAENIISIASSAIASGHAVSVNEGYPACQIGVYNGTNVAGGDVMNIGFSVWQ